MNKNSRKSELFEELKKDILAKGEESIDIDRFMELYTDFNYEDFQKAGMTPCRIEELEMEMGCPEKKPIISARL